MEKAENFLVVRVDSKSMHIEVKRTDGILIGSTGDEVSKFL